MLLPYKNRKEITLNSQYSGELNELIRWIKNTNSSLNYNFMYMVQDVQNITRMIGTVATGIRDEYPFYADSLFRIMQILFQGNGYTYALNSAAFGELFIIIEHIEAEPVNLGIWNQIHPRIINISKALYCDGHFGAAAEKAVKEVETRLREKYSELKPSATVPPKVGDVIGALLSENGAFQFCNTTTQSGKDYRRGVKLLFEGLMAAYRNPAAHANLDCSKREALEQIMLASQLMCILDR